MEIGAEEDRAVGTLPHSRSIGQVRTEVRQCVVERCCVAVVVLLALEEGEELRELGAAAVVRGRGERLGIEGHDRQEERSERGDHAHPGDPHGGEAEMAPPRAKEPQDKRNEKHRSQRKREPANYGAAGRALKVRPGVADGLPLAAGRLQGAPAIKRADLQLQLERRVEGVRADPPVGDRHVCVDLAELVRRDLERDAPELGVRLSRPRNPPAHDHGHQRERGRGDDPQRPSGYPASSSGSTFHRRNSDAAWRVGRAGRYGAVTFTFP